MPELAVESTLVTTSNSLALLRRIAFGNVVVDGEGAVTGTQAIVIRNTGDTALTINALELSNPSATSFSVSDVPTGTTIAPARP